MENRDDHWLLTSVLLYHKMQFVRLLLRITRTRQLVLLRLVAHLGLQFDKLLGDLVCRTLAEDSQNRPPGLVHVHPTTEREPTSTRTLVHDVFKLHDRDANELIVSTEAVVFHPDVQFISRHLFLVANNKVEGLVELWRPIAGLLFGLELPFLIRKMRTYQVDFHVGLEGLRLLHLQVVGSHHFQRDFMLAGAWMRVQVNLDRHLAHTSLLRRR